MADWQLVADGLPAGTDIAPTIGSIQVVFLLNPLFLQQWSYFNLSEKVAEFVKVNGWRYNFEYCNGERKGRVYQSGSKLACCYLDYAGSNGCRNKKYQCERSIYLLRVTSAS